ncbi:hypothetical protein [Cryptosporangium minutisporangium]|uniref:Uncharacterized protein n=1 Tax=Cryptosporangium minutisporangium TaxID=113569 RepID=A0ABP6SZC4_9ACTN
MTAAGPGARGAGARVLHVDWLPGSDRLHGRCHCGAESDADDPVVLWEWLLAHPDHPAGGAIEPPPAPLPRPPAHVVTDPVMLRRRPARV